jgi:hypothetical protein
MKAHQKDPAVDERGFVDIAIACAQNRQDPWFAKKREPKLRRLEKWEKRRGAQGYDRKALRNSLDSAISDANKPDRQPKDLATSMGPAEEKRLGFR